MLFILLWLAGSAVAFLALRHFALRDFGLITVGGLIGLVAYSLIVPAALIVAIILSLQGRGKILGKSFGRKTTCDPPPREPAAIARRSV